MTEDERYRSEKIASGTRFQDHVVDQLFRRRGLVIMQFASKEYQIRIGESLNGIEIKNDEKYAVTGNLWIEVGEKALPRNGEFAPSGILRDDNAWLYVIGDYKILFAFAKRNLVLLYESKRYRVVENDRKTSIGFLLPAADARRWAAFVEILVPNDKPPEPAPSDSGSPVTADEINWGIGR